MDGSRVFKMALYIFIMEIQNNNENTLCKMDRAAVVLLNLFLLKGFSQVL